MRILVDTNILISALMFPHSRPSAALEYILRKHKMVLCEQNVEELLEVLNRKAPRLRSVAEELLHTWNYELILASDTTVTRIRDIKDQPILDAAIAEDVDVVLTGDKDFLCLELKHPKIMTVQQFLTENDDVRPSHSEKLGS